MMRNTALGRTKSAGMILVYLERLNLHPPKRDNTWKGMYESSLYGYEILQNFDRDFKMLRKFFEGHSPENPSEFQTGVKKK